MVRDISMSKVCLGGGGASTWPLSLPDAFSGVVTIAQTGLRPSDCSQDTPGSRQVLAGMGDLSSLQQGLCFTYISKFPLEC